MPDRSAQRLVEEFAANVAAQYDAVGRGDSRTGNVHARRYEAAWNALRQMGDAGREALSTLFGDPRPEVRSMAACHLLRFKTKEALAVLRQVAGSRGRASFGAAECIKRWKEGPWELDAEDGTDAPSAGGPSPPPAATPARAWSILEALPDRVAWSDIADFERLDERRAAVDLLHANIIGVNSGYVEWCPNNDPPSEDETMAWWWFVRPDLGATIALRAAPGLRRAIEEYDLGQGMPGSTIV